MSGLIGVEGDPFDMIYGGVVAVGLVGAAIARFRPAGMARAMLAAAGAQTLVVVIALIVGKQHVEVSSVPEIVLSNAFFGTRSSLSMATPYGRAPSPLGLAHSVTSPVSGSRRPRYPRA